MSFTERYDFTEAVEMARRGDTEGIEVLYFKSYPFLEREARKYCDTPQDVEDALQESYLKIFSKLDTLKEPNAFLGWAVSICKNTLRNRADYIERHEGKEDLTPPMSEGEEAGLDLLPAEEYRKDTDPDAYVDAATVTDLVRDVLEALPDRQQECLLLWMNGYTHAEIAETLDMPLGTVKSNINYAKKKVTKILEDKQRDGTFDYKAVHADPVGAFLYLLERYLAQAPAMPPEAATLLPKIQAALGAGIVKGAAGTAAGTAAKTTPLTWLKDPTRATVAVLMTVVLAVGAALGIQTISKDVPVSPAAEPTTRVTQTTAEEQTEPATEAGEENGANGTGAEDTGTARETVTVQTPTPAPASENDRQTAGNTATTAVVSQSEAGIFLPLVARPVDVSEVGSGEIWNRVSEFGSDIADNVSIREPIIDSELISDYNFEDDSLILNFFVRNSLGKPILLKGFGTVVIKSFSGNLLFSEPITLLSPVDLNDGEEQWFSVNVSNEYYPENIFDAYALKIGYYTTTFEVDYS